LALEKTQKQQPRTRALNLNKPNL